MKDTTFETKIVAANPHSDQTNSFIKDTMTKIRLQPQESLQENQKVGFMYWLGHLHKPALAMLAFAVIILVSGAVYAVVQFAPALLKITGKETTARGTTEYTVAGFEACARQGTLSADRFEVNSAIKDADDAEITKILQAKCELQWIDGFVNSTWPGYGTNAEWKDGDTIYYTRTNILGTVVEANENGAHVAFSNGTSDDKPVAGEKLKAYAGGVEVPMGDVKPGDSVFTIVRVSETYHDYSKSLPALKDKNAAYEAPANNPQVVGAVALFKLSLPGEYYSQKQAYLTEIPVCTGNEGEYCPNTPSTDIYPRGNGEGSTNPYAVAISDGVFRQITGTVSELTADTLTLTSRAGNVFKVTVGDSGFAQYNLKYAKNYTNLDARLRVGSNVAIRYVQPKATDPKVITKEQVQMVSLMLESLNVKKGDIKQY